MKFPVIFYPVAQTDSLILPTNLSLRNNRISDKQLLIKILPVHVYRCDLAIVICGVIVDSLVAVAA